MNAMSKTAALKAASKAVGTPIGRGSSWGFYAPHYSDQINGATAEVRAGSYREIVRRRTQCVVEVALVQMGFVGEICLENLSGNAKDMLEKVLAAPVRYIIND